MTDELYCGDFDGYEIRMDRYISVVKGKVRGPEGYVLDLTLQETVMYRKGNAGLREYVGQQAQNSRLIRVVLRRIRLAAGPGRRVSQR